jgi:endonuclease/exonuclease/phosphatase family metal-dependent hydrolase
VAAVIRQLGADVVALQEVSSRTPRHGVHQLEYLAEHTGLTPVSGPTLRSHQGDYGNALLTRLEVRGVSRFDLSVRGREPRGLLDVRLGAFGSTLRVCATHLGLGRGERREQVRRLLEHLARPHPDPLVLLGDMNEWLPVRGTLHRVHQQLGPGRGARSFPARLPLLRLDRIWAQPHQALQAPRVHATPLAREASDHLPVLAAFRRGDADGAEAAIALGGT